MRLSWEIEKPTLRQVLRFVPVGRHGQRATSRRYIWQVRRSLLLQLWWYRVAQLPGGQWFIDRYERIATDRWIAHLAGCHSVKSCRGFDRCAGPWQDGAVPRFRGRWYAVENP